MKKRLLQVLKAFGAFLLFVTLVIIGAIVWPMPEIPLPEDHNRIIIKSINIIDIKTGEIALNQDVLIENNVIKSIDSSKVNTTHEDVLLINGKGKYLLPGLWDMHTHSTPYSPWLHHPLYIANGVTGIRDMSGRLNKEDSYWIGTKERVEWNKKLEDKKLTAPRYLLQSSFQINGSSSVPDDFPEFFKVENDEDVLQLLAYYKDEGADFIKVYSDISASSYRKLAQEAPNYGLYIAGHKSLNVSLEESIVLGQRSFEHGRIFMFDCFPGAEALLKATDKSAEFRNAKELMIKDFDTQKAEYLMDMMREYRAYWTPTLQTVKMGAFADKVQFLTNPDLKYIPTLRKKLLWNPDIERSAKENQSADRKGINMNFYEAVKAQVDMANRKGVPIMAGTDVTDTYVFPGFSLHTELGDLTKCGLSNLAALQSATIIPAEYCNLDKDYGSIEMGKIANLIILAQNPLKNIENTKSINGVLLNGTYYDNEKLSELKNVTSSLASSFHMNVKFIYSLLGSPLMRKQIAD